MVVRPAALAALVLLLAAGASSAAEDPAATGYGAVDGVTYYMAAGNITGSALVADTGAGERAIPFTGCGYAQLRPEFGRGRITMSGMADGYTPIFFEMSDLAGGPSGSNGLVVNSTLDEQLLPTLGPGQTARVQAAAWGAAEMHAAEIQQPDGTFRRGNLTDPVSGEPDLLGIVAVQQDGVRDDSTGARLDRVDGGDDELHILALSPPGAAPSSDRIAMGPPGVLPDGSIPSESEHAQAYQFLNSRFGGVGTLTLTSTSRAPPGLSELTVTVLAPDGTALGNGTAAASLLGPGTASFEFPLDQLGLYTVFVSGSILLGNYQVELELAAPASFRMDFFWEDVIRGNDARDEYNRCLKDLGLRSTVTAPTAQRSQPPLFPLEIVVVAVVGAAAIVLLLVKFIGDSVSSSSFRKSYRK